jgi:hypothetical protein
MTLADKVRSRVRVDRNGCWIWQGPRIRGDYGIVSNKAGQRPVNVVVHRVMFEDAHGPIPNGKVIAHTCAVKRCCNPQHLTLARRKGRAARTVVLENPGSTKGAEHRTV